jgi:hypothetical protein
MNVEKFSKSFHTKMAFDEDVQVVGMKLNV